MIEDKYTALCKKRSDINEHLPVLRKYASQCKHITEFGVRWIVSTWALLAAKPKVLRSYDIKHPKDFKADIVAVEQAAKEAGIDFKFTLADTLNTEIEETDLLFIDTWHIYRQLKKELELHAEKALKYIILHDTITFGVEGEDGGEGIGKALDEFLETNKHWQVREEYINNNGLTILERVQAKPFSLIIPTMWKQMKYLRKMLPVYNDEKMIGEILIINNAKSSFDLNKIKSFSKVKIINDGENLYVNPSWNFGVQAAKYDRVIIANDDIYFESLDKVLELVDANLSKGKIFGFAENCFYQKQKLSLHLREPEKGYRAHGFGMFMIMEKDSYREIPNEIKIWCGDRLLYYVNKPLLIEGVDVNAEIGGTTRSLNLSKYRIRDNAYWRDLKKKLGEQNSKLPETNVVLVYKTGGDFELKDVHLLVDQLHKKKNGLDLKVYCLTDVVSKEMDLGNFTLLPMVGKWKGWWSKMNLFSSKYAYLRPFLYMDLDTAVISYLENTIPNDKHKDSFIALRDFYQSKKAASGLMWFPVNGGLLNKVWNVWKENPEHFMRSYRGDQDFIFSIIKPDKYWQDITAGIVSSKPNKQFLNELKGLEDIVCFHGKPRIFDAARKCKWVNAYVQRKL